MNCRTRPTLRLLTVALFLLANGIAFSAIVSIDPRATYLKIEDDPAQTPFAFALSALGVSPGDLIRVDRLGFYKAASFIPDTGSSLLAVFSGSATLLSGTNLNRVQDAIDAGNDFVSSDTLNNNLSTDITQDFAVDDGSTFSFVQLQVPIGATHIFFTVNDSYFTDNSDPNGDFGANISVVPEPSIAALSFVGILLGLWRTYPAKRLTALRFLRLLL